MDPKITAAMELLNAAAKEKKDDVQNMISDKYAHLKDVLLENPKDFIKENPWWMGGGLALSILAAGIILFISQKK